MSRMINIVLTDMASEMLKHEECMENAINSKDDIEERLKTIKYHLGKIVELEQMVEKWRGYTNTSNNNSD